MKKSFAVFLQVVVVLIGVTVLGLMLWAPHLEGRNVNATTFEIYFKDPFLAYVYVASIAFFVALHQAYKLFGYMGQNNTYSTNSTKALRVIKYCAMALVGFILGAEAYIYITMRGKDDIAGGVAMGLFLMVISIIIGVVAAKFERKLQR